MPTRRHQTRRTLKRFAEANARRTADVVELVEVAPYGAHRIVRHPDCDDVFLIKSATPDKSVKPGSTILAAVNPGGTLAFEAAPTGRGGVLPVIGEEETFEIDTSVATYLAFYRDDSTHITVKSLDQSGDEFATLVDNAVLPSGTFTAANPLITIISGDGSVPDNSFTLGNFGGAGTGKIWVVNIETGSFTEIFNQATSTENLAYRGIYWDATNQKVMIAAYDFLTDTIGRLYSVNTNGSSLTNVQSHTSSSVSRGLTPVVWDSDRCIYYAISAAYDECTEFPFAGGGATNRAGDTPVDTVYLSNGATIDFFAAADRYFVDLDATTGTYLECYRMPLTTGDAVSQGWPLSQFYPGQADTIFGAKVGDNLYAYPVLDSALGTTVYILKWDVTGAAPAAANLIEVASATTGPVAPFCVLPIP